jgi:uncharacterized alpha-E superfamily protein
MLSRVADALYWIGRYLERAENTTRLLLVTEELATEVMGLEEALAELEWADLASVLDGRGAATGGPASSPAALLFAYSIDPRHPSSIFSSLKKARDNARTVREALTVEVFLNLNETYRGLEGYTAAQVADPPTFRSAMAATHRGILSTVGAIEHTLSRDQGWLFLKLGESLERAFRAAVVLRAKLPSLVAPEPKVDLPLIQNRWRGLLRGLSSLENFRQAYGARLEPLDVLHFLLFDTTAPRSLRYGVSAIKDCLDGIAGPEGIPGPARTIGRLAAELAYRDPAEMREADYEPLLGHVLEGLEKTHDALSTLYFGS